MWGFSTASWLIWFYPQLAWVISAGKSRTSLHEYLCKSSNHYSRKDKSETVKVYCGQFSNLTLLSLLSLLFYLNLLTCIPCIHFKIVSLRDLCPDWPTCTHFDIRECLFVLALESEQKACETKWIWTNCAAVFKSNSKKQQQQQQLSAPCRHPPTKQMFAGRSNWQNV